MNLKRTKVIAVIGIFLLSFIVHFGYDIYKSSLTAILFPVNESIWEHMKLLFTAIIFYGLIDYLIMKKFKIATNNFLLGLFISAFLSIPIFLLIYLPFYHRLGENMVLNLTVMFITIVIVEIINFYLQKRNNIKYLNIISLILIIISYCLLGYLTYKPPLKPLFFDTKDEKYGLNIYLLD